MKPETNCNEIRYHLFPYLKDELSPENRVRLEEHLEHCTDCPGELDGMRRTLRALDTLSSSLKPPEGAWVRLQNRIKAARPVVPWHRRPEFKAAACLIVFLGGLCLIWLLRINDQVLSALKQTLAILEIELPWLTEGALSSFLAPLLFILLCSFLMLILSPLVLRKKKEKSGETALLLEEEKSKN